jgi:hypothetical protein
MKEAHSLAKTVGAIAGGVLFLLLIALFCVENYQQGELATAIDSYIKPTLPTLSPMNNLGDTIPLGKNAVWWIGEGVEFAGRGTARSTGTMRSCWGGGELGLTPAFKELDSVVIVKGTLGEEKEYLRVPSDMSPAPEFGFNPFKSKDAPPTSFVDRYGKTHSADEFKVTLRTYGLQVWILDVKSNRIVGYREFPAAHLLDQYDQDHTADEVHLSALVQWIESLQKLEKKA